LENNYVGFAEPGDAMTIRFWLVCWTWGTRGNMKKKVLTFGNNFKQIQNKLDISGEKKLAQFKNFKLFQFVKCDVLCAARYVKLFSMFILHVQNSTMPAHLVQPPTCGQRAQRARAESPRAPCAAGRCHDPKTGRPARVEQVGCAMAGPPCDKMICFDSNIYFFDKYQTDTIGASKRSNCMNLNGSTLQSAD